MSDFCYKCKLRENCIPVILQKQEEVKQCDNYEYDENFFQMDEDFKIHILKMMYTDATKQTLLLCNEDLSIFTMTRVNSDLYRAIGDDSEVYVKGYVDRFNDLRLVSLIEPEHKW